MQTQAPRMLPSFGGAQPRKPNAAAIWTETVMLPFLNKCSQHDNDDAAKAICRRLSMEYRFLLFAKLCPPADYAACAATFAQTLIGIYESLTSTSVPLPRDFDQVIFQAVLDHQLGGLQHRQLRIKSTKALLAVVMPAAVSDCFKADMVLPLVNELLTEQME